jgi:hypothetical protein
MLRPSLAAGCPARQACFSLLRHGRFRRALKCLPDLLRTSPSLSATPTAAPHGRSRSAKLRLYGQPIHQASLALLTFYFEDDSRWSAQQYALLPLPGTRQWRMVTLNEFLHSAQPAQ